MSRSFHFSTVTSTHLIFNLNGLIVNQKETYLKVFKVVCQKYGKSLTPELEDKISDNEWQGRPGSDLVNTLMSDLQLPSWNGLKVALKLGNTNYNQSLASNEVGSNVKSNGFVGIKES